MTTLIREPSSEPYRLATFLHRDKVPILHRLHRAWIKLDFPDPAEHWPEMLASIAFVGLLAVTLFLGCVVAGVW